MHYAAFLEDGYYIYYILGSIFGADITYTIHYAVFLDGGYNFYYALHSISVGRILLILHTMQ